MKCLYCARECRLVSSPVNSNQRPIIGFTDTYQCDYHGSVRIHFIHWIGDHQWKAMAYICKYKDNTYSVNFHYGTLPPGHPKFSISKLPFSPKKPSELVFCLDFHPEKITPENVQGKLPLWLTFA